MRHEATPSGADEPGVISLLAYHETYVNHDSSCGTARRAWHTTATCCALRTSII